MIPMIMMIVIWLVTNDKNDNDRTGNGDNDHSEIVILILEHWQYYNIDDNNDPDW
jgi:hypothetical protein